MRRGNRWAIVLGSSCLAIGLGMMMVGFVMGGVYPNRQRLSIRKEIETVAMEAENEVVAIQEDISQVEEKEMETHAAATSEMKSEDTYQGIKNLNIDMHIGTIKIQVSDQSQITMKRKGQRTEVEVDGDTLNIDDTDSDWMDGGWLDENKKAKHPGDHIVLMVPRGYLFDDVSISTGAGSVTIEALTAEDLTLDIGVGTIKAAGLQIENTDIDCGMGSGDLEGDLGDDMDITCGLGMLTLKFPGVKELYGFDVSCGLGSVEIGNNTSSSFDGFVGNEDAPIQGYLDCGLGSIQVTFENQ